MNSDDHRQGKDEMNLAVLPIARLGRNDRRTRIEYHGTFREPGQEQEEMVWVVEGAAGLPTEFAERVMIALLYIGAEGNFAERKMTFTVYRVLKVLGLTISNRNYRLVEKALKQLAGVLITSDKAWVERSEDCKQKRITTSHGFHVIDEYYLHYQEGDEDEKTSFITWGARVWKSIQAGYLKLLDVNFYYSVQNPVARRLYRFLDKMMAYESGKPYEIDVFDLANKLGMASYEHAAHLRRPLKVAAQELVDRGYLRSFEFVKVGHYSRIRFYKELREYTPQLPLLAADPTNETITKTPEEELWASILAELTPALAQSLQYTRLVSVEGGTATIEAGRGADWMQNRLEHPLLRALRFMGKDITTVKFVQRVAEAKAGIGGDAVAR
jgi:hypothetical protein